MRRAGDARRPARSAGIGSMHASPGSCGLAGCPRPHPFPPSLLDPEAGGGRSWSPILFQVSRMTDGGHDFLSDLNDPATLGPGLTAQTLKGLPLTQAFLGDQRPLGLLDHHPSIQRPLELAGQLPSLLTLQGVGDGQGGQVGEGDQGQLPLRRPGPAPPPATRDGPWPRTPPPPQSPAGCRESGWPTPPAAPARPRPG